MCFGKQDEIAFMFEAKRLVTVTAAAGGVFCGFIRLIMRRSFYTPNLANLFQLRG